MTEYTFKIAGKRQVTLPNEFVQDLNLQKGDELQVIMHSPSHIQIIPTTRVRKDLITPEIEKVLAQRRKEIENGGAMVSLDQALKKAAQKDARKHAALHSGTALKAGLQSGHQLATE
jgi:antitoxin component of MazEF toxin-antitoxin module